MSYGTVQAEKMTTESGYSLGAGNASSFKNRIINGDMRIDQRNAGASFTITGSQYTLDRWLGFCSPSATSKFSVQQSSTAPAGFTKSLLCTSLSAYSIGAGEICTMNHLIEGYNIADLNFGTANAKSFTFSFWVRSSLTGTFSAFFANSGQTRWYLAPYTISTADTWEFKTITVPGDTSGTWLTDNNTGLYASFQLSVGSNFLTSASTGWSGASTKYGITGQTSLVGTNAATFYVTGVQLEVGTVATSWDFRSIGTELALCQRYYEKQYELATPVGFDFANDQKSWFSSLSGAISIRYSNSIPFKVSKRASPTLAFWDYNGVSGSWMCGAAGQTETSTAVNGSIVNENAIGSVYFNTGNNWAYGFWTASAEL